MTLVFTLYWSFGNISFEKNSILLKEGRGGGRKGERKGKMEVEGEEEEWGGERGLGGEEWGQGGKLLVEEEGEGEVVVL